MSQISSFITRFTGCWGGRRGCISQPRPLSRHFHTEQGGHCPQMVFLADLVSVRKLTQRIRCLSGMTLQMNTCERTGLDCKPWWFGLKQQTQSVRTLSVPDCGHRRTRMLCLCRMCIVWCLVRMYLTTADTTQKCEYVFVVLQHGHVFIWQVFKYCRPPLRSVCVFVCVCVCVCVCVWVCVCVGAVSYTHLTLPTRRWV